MATREWVTRLKGVLDPSYTGTFGRAARTLETYRKNVSRVDTAHDKAARSAKRHASASGSMAGAVFKGVTGVAAAYIGVQQLGAAVRSVTQNTNERLAAEQRLQTLMGNVRGTTKKDIGQVKALAGAIQNYSTVGDDASVHGASQLATYQLQGKSIRKLMPALADLAVGTYGVNVSQEQMQQSANLLGKVFTGQIGALRRVGINFDKHQEKILKTGNEQQKVAMLTKVVAKNYGNLARQMSQTPEGRIIQLKNAWGDFQEEIGLRVLPLVTRLLNWLGPKLPGMMAAGTRALDKTMYIMGLVSPIFKAIYDAGAKTFKFLKDNWSWMGPIIKGAAGAMAFWYGWLLITGGAIKALTAIQWLLNVAMNANPVGLFVLALGVLAGVVWSLYKNWDKVKVGLMVAWKWFVKFGTEGPAKFIPIIGPVIFLLASIGKHWKRIVDTVKDAVIWIGKFIDKAKKIKVPRWFGGGGDAPAPAGHARGGFINSPVLTWLGEQRKREVVIPLEQHRDRALSLWRRAGAELGAGSGGGSSYTININLPAGATAPDIRAAAQDVAAAVRAAISQVDDQERRRSFA